VIIVTKTEVTYQGKVIASVKEVARDPRALEPLAAVLRTSGEITKREFANGDMKLELVRVCKEAEQGIRPMAGQMCPLGLAILQADETTDMRVINAVLHTAKAEGFDNLLFAVKNL
jgi:hypothetical protein